MIRRTDRSGFTLIEVLVSSAVFVSIMIAFVAIFVSVTGVFSRQSGGSEVSGQSQFLLQQIQRHVERASLVEMEKDTPAGTLKLRMSGDADDPTYIYVTNGIVYIKKTESGTAQPLTSNRVLVSNLVFTKRSNAPARDSVSVSFMVTYKSSIAGQNFQTAVSRVSAATFDSDLIPSTPSTWKIGDAGQGWTSINDTIYFDSENVGIGRSIFNPRQRTEIDGGMRLNTLSLKPACEAVNSRGASWFVHGGIDVADVFYVCVKQIDGTYIWKPVNPPPSLPPGLIAYYTFDDQADPGHDSAGTNHGTPINNPMWISGQIGGALQFNGVNQLVSIPNNSSLNLGQGDYTFAFWLNLSSTVGNQFIFSKAGATFTDGYGSTIQSAAYVYYQQGTGREMTLLSAVTGWHHHAIVRQGSSGSVFKWYRDGVYTGISGSMDSLSSDSVEALSLGGRQSGSFQWYLNGSLDDFRIYNRALSDAEILDLAN